MICIVSSPDDQKIQSREGQGFVFGWLSFDGRELGKLDFEMELILIGHCFISMRRSCRVSQL